MSIWPKRVLTIEDADALHDLKVRGEASRIRVIDPVRRHERVEKFGRFVATLVIAAIWALFVWGVIEVVEWLR